MWATAFLLAFAASAVQAAPPASVATDPIVAANAKAALRTDTGSSVITRRQAAGAGTVQLATYNCAAFVWDDYWYMYATIAGYADVEQAEKKAMKQCTDGTDGDHNCKVVQSWCSDRCIAVAYSLDWQYYSYNPNPVSATKASTYVINECTQRVCNNPAWEDYCNSGAPVCYIDALLCGSELQIFNATGDNTVTTFGSVDTILEPNASLLLTANPSIVSLMAPVNFTALPLQPLPIVAPNLDASETDPGYVATGGKLSTDPSGSDGGAESSSGAVDDSSSPVPSSTAAAITEHSTASSSASATSSAAATSSATK